MEEQIHNVPSYYRRETSVKFLIGGFSKDCHIKKAHQFRLQHAYGTKHLDYQFKKLYKLRAVSPSLKFPTIW